MPTTKALGAAAAAALMRQKLEQHVQGRADQLRDIAVELHATAPRGGSYLNRWGQNRSAPGEAPAPETGALLDRLEMPPSPIPGGFEVPVNYGPLEFGTARVRARPMGRMAVARLKQEVKDGA